jgi:hypothetical protein
LLQERVEITTAQRSEHRLVLLFHHAAHYRGHVDLLDVLAVVRARRLDDATAIGKQVRHDPRKLHARVFRLDVEDPTAMADVVVEAE